MFCEIIQNCSVRIYSTSIICAHLSRYRLTHNIIIQCPYFQYIDHTKLQCSFCNTLTYSGRRLTLFTQKLVTPVRQSRNAVIQNISFFIERIQTVSGNFDGLECDILTEIFQNDFRWTLGLTGRPKLVMAYAFILYDLQMPLAQILDCSHLARSGYTAYGVMRQCTIR